MSVIWVLSVLSEHSDTKLVMKGIAHGACDYLLKPVRIEELKNIWQHVVRRKKLDSRDQNKSLNQERSGFGSGDGGQGATSAGNTDQSGKVNKKRKDQSEDEEDEGEENGQENDDPATQKKPRVVWSVELHRKFVAAVNQLGLESEFLNVVFECLLQIFSGSYILISNFLLQFPFLSLPQRQSRRKFLI